MSDREKKVYVIRSRETGKILALAEGWERRMALNLFAEAMMSSNLASQSEMYEAGQMGLTILKPRERPAPTLPESAGEGESTH